MIMIMIMIIYFGYFRNAFKYFLLFISSKNPNPIKINGSKPQEQGKCKTETL